MAYEQDPYYEEIQIVQTPEGPRQIRVPFLRRPLGAGDAVANVTKAFGVKPCTPCEQRRRWLNQRLQFVPRR